MIYYKRDKKIIDTKDVTKEKKLINMYNQLYGTDYTIDSVGIEVCHREKVNPTIKTGKPDKYFGYLFRTGKVFKPDVVHAEEKRQELKSLKGYR